MRIVKFCDVFVAIAFRFSKLFKQKATGPVSPTLVARETQSDPTHAPSRFLGLKGYLQLTH